MIRRAAFFVEPLESRTLFSAAAPVAATPALAVERPAATVKFGPVGTGVTLNLQAGVAFTGKVAFIPVPAAEAGLGASATINWGDGSTTAATLQTATQDGAAGYDVIGSHAYADPGTYSIATVLLLAPISQPGQPTPLFVIADPPTISTAIVAPAATVGSGASNPDTTVTIHEVAGAKFTASLGSFATLAPGTHLRATINWGDGKTSVGTLVAAGPVGLDEVSFNVLGTHKYVNPGTYGIAIHVVKLPVNASLAIQQIASFDAIADVASPPSK